ncbi:MAG TPA: dephospho-CoA kinase [Flavobacterium sp.]|nr:dephospho-CoA kinase [Flavobacterium sp.]
MAKIIGLTGGIGSGKTTIVNYIASKNIPVYIADDAGKRVMEQAEIIQRINLLFDGKVLLNNGQLDRKKIASLVFNDSEKLEALNKIVHPAVADDFKLFCQKFEKEVVIVKESAILFESGAYKNCDATILVTAPQSVRIHRVMKRDNISEEEVEQRMKNQMSDEEKIPYADFVITNIDLKEAYKQTDAVLSQFLMK